MRSTRPLLPLLLPLLACAAGGKPDTGSEDTDEPELPPLEQGFEAALGDWELDTWEREFEVGWAFFARAEGTMLLIAFSPQEPPVAPATFLFEDPEFGIAVSHGRGADECQFGCHDEDCEDPFLDTYLATGGTAEVDLYEEFVDLRIRDIILEPQDFEGETLTIELLEVQHIPIVSCPQDCTY